jgi:AcrR family transcriptional regulator
VTRKPRTDAESNRRHILTVALTAFAANGLDVPIRDIARRADLGVATIYRHFPQRADLISAVLTSEVAACRDDMAAALDDPNPWRALQTVIRRFADRQLSNRGLNEALLGSHEAGIPFAQERLAHARALDELVHRAQSSAHLREGISVADVRIGLHAIASFRNIPGGSAAETMTKLADLVIAGLAKPALVGALELG